MIRLIFLIFFSLCSSANAQLAGGLQFPGPGLPVANSSMVTPLLGYATQYTFSNSATNYHPIGTTSFGSTSTTTREVPVSIGGTISNLFVTFGATISPGNFTITVRKNGADTAVTCTITASTTCSDITHSFSVVAGDTIGYSTAPASTPTSGTVYVSTSLSGTTPGEGYIYGVGDITGPVASSTTYQGFAASSAWNATEAIVSNVVATGGVLDKLYVVSSIAPGVGAQIAYTLFKNGVSAGVTCTISGNVATTCNDTANTVSVAAGDTISLQAVSTVAAGSPMSKFGLRWVPTIAGEALVFANVNGAPTTSGTRFSFFNTSSLNGATETAAFNIAPVAMTVKKLNTLVSTAPGVGQSRTITLRKGTGGGQSSQSLTCAISGGAATTCSDTSNNVSVSVSDFLNWQNVATATNAAATYFKIGAVVTSP